VMRGGAEVDRAEPVTARPHEDEGGS